MPSDTKPERGSERVKGWVYAILNPVIDGLRRETSLLKTGNLTWRAFSRRCESIRPISDYIDVFHEPILEDLLAEDGALRPRLEEHDSALSKLEETAARYVQTLIRATPFQKEVAECLKNYSSMRSSNPAFLELTNTERVPEYVAEYLVNSTESLPRHYTMHSFWEAFRDEFAAFKNRQTFVALNTSAGSLRQISEGLQRDLESRRLTLVREYDIPAAPIETARSTPEGVFPKFR